MIERLSARVIAMIVAAVVAVLLIGLTLHSCTQARQAGAKARYEAAASASATDSARDAVGTVGAAGARDAAIDKQVKGSSDEIGKATGGDSNAAADRAACRMRSYRHSRRCVELLGVDPDGVEARN